MQSYISQEAIKHPQPEVHIAVDKFSNMKSWRKPWRTYSIGA